MEAHKAAWTKVLAQKELLPNAFGSFDFDAIPARFTTELEVPSILRSRNPAKRKRILADTNLIELIHAYTLMGDPPADAYAALMGKYPFRRLVEMLGDACDKGVGAVAEAPAELGAFIAHMERKPEWLDMRLVEQGATVARNFTANVLPMTVRGSFLWTFLNTYAGRPMVLTGTLSNNTAGRRARETLNFFLLTALPGALERDAPGFKAAAMIRLMHSMVRINIMRRPEHWDVGVYGFPVPQIDQMPAGMAFMQLLSQRALKQGRSTFTSAERAEVEFSRYRCYLLGLPEDLLPTEPQAIIEILSARAATLRAGFDDATDGALVRATLAGTIFTGDRLRDRVFQTIERGFAGVYMVDDFFRGDFEEARKMGVAVTTKDRLLSLAAKSHLAIQTGAFALARKISFLREPADRLLISRIKKTLEALGETHFETDLQKYQSAMQDKKAA